MDTARADALSARSRITAGLWIPRNAESFRHLPPPPAEVWMGGTPRPGCDASPLAGAGWTLHPVGHSPQGRVDARWLDATDPEQRTELFAGLPLMGDDDAAPFSWAHRAVCRQGLRLRIGGAPGDGAARGSGETVWLQLRHQPRSEVEAPLLVVDLLPGVNCVLIESHERETSRCQRAIVQNLHLHLRLGQGSTLRHLRIATPSPTDNVAHHVHARLDSGATYRQGLVASGCEYHLQRSVIDLQGAQASSSTSGVLFAAGSTLEQQVHTTQGAQRSSSRVDTLALASGTAHIVVNAHSRIDPGADDAEVRQRLTGIPTEGQPRVVLRPHLQIHHDRVQAAHGATWGALPEDALFYAAQRGLDEREARALIIEGMASASLARCLETPDLMQALGVDRLLASAVARHLAGPTEACHG